MAEQDKLNWVNVINFLEKQHNQISLREKEWGYERQILTRRIESLQSQIRSNVSVCQGLVNRIKILQIALRQQKMHKDEGRKTIEEDKLRGMVQKFKLNEQFDKNSHEQFLFEVVKDLRMQQHRPSRIIDKPQQIMGSIGRESGSLALQEKKKFGAHLDIVTTMVNFDQSEGMLATSSEDCLIKIWNVNKVIKEQHPEPIYTLRKHTGPLFSLAHCHNPGNSNQELLFSAGIEGDIKSWRVGSTYVDWVKSTPNGNQQEQTIWQLEVLADKLLSASSDGIVRMFKVQGGQEPDLNFISNFKEKQFNHNALKWVSDDLFMASCSSAPRIHFWNIEGKLIGKFLYEIQRCRQASAAQVNSLAVIKDQKMLVGGCEDGYVRVFDLNTHKIVKKMPAKKSVGCVMGWDWNIISGDHSGCISSWDTRMFRLTEQKQNVHLEKYDTGITCLTRIGSRLLTSGADGIVKMFV